MKTKRILWLSLLIGAVLSAALGTYMMKSAEFDSYYQPANFAAHLQVNILGTVYALGRLFLRFIHYHGNSYHLTPLAFAVAAIITTAALSTVVFAVLWTIGRMRGGGADDEA